MILTIYCIKLVLHPLSPPHPDPPIFPLLISSHSIPSPLPLLPSHLPLLGGVAFPAGEIRPPGPLESASAHDMKPLWRFHHNISVPSKGAGSLSKLKHCVTLVIALAAATRPITARSSQKNILIELEHGARPRASPTATRLKP